jgi:hypothetical protein
MITEQQIQALISDPKLIRPYDLAKAVEAEVLAAVERAKESDAVN